MLRLLRGGGDTKSGKNLPSVQVTNPSATMEKRGGGEQPGAALGEPDGIPFVMTRGTNSCVKTGQGSVS